MWRSRVQHVVRWVGLLVAGVLMARWLARAEAVEVHGLTPVGLKVWFTHLRFAVAEIGWQWWGIVLLTLPAGLLVGLPSAAFIPAGLVFLPPWTVLAILAVAQTMATVMVWLIVRRFRLADPSRDLLKPSLGDLGAETTGLTFWPRLFTAFPLRFVDAVAAARIPPEHPLARHLLPMALGNTLRLAIHVGWFHFLLAVVVDFRPFPETDLGWFLVLTLGECLGFLLPEMPEVTPASPAVRKVVRTLARQS